MTADFALEVAAALNEGRALAESRMLTTCAIQYDTGSTDIDPATDSEIKVYETAFSTKCRVKSPGLQVNEAEAGGRTSATVTRELHIPVNSPDPWDSPDAALGVFALITAVDATDDPTLLGQRVRLSGPAPGSQTTARRLEITEVVS